VSGDECVIRYMGANDVAGGSGEAYIRVGQHGDL